ncbi:MAG TPA: polysaccharide deacetylase family protein [Candidatus Sulfotelmatobacter sp.]
MRNSGWRQRKLLILCYHGIALEDENQWRPFLYISPEHFERRLEILRNAGYAVLPLAQALEQLRRNDLPPRSVALTFDDGTYDFYKLAWPRLKQYGFPATVYLTTYYSELRRPIFSLICSYMLWKARGMRGLDLKEFGIDCQVVPASAEKREEMASQLMRWADGKDFHGEEKDEFAASLAQRLGIDYQKLRAKRILQLMSVDEVKQLAAEGVDFQLHTHRHRAPRTEELFRREIWDNRARITKAIGGERNHFCYPSGAYRPEFLDWLAKEEVISATTCDTGFATEETNPLLLPRFVDTTGRTDLEFESWVGGIGYFLSRRKRGRLAVVAD